MSGRHATVDHHALGEMEEKTHHQDMQQSVKDVSSSIHNHQRHNS